MVRRNRGSNVRVKAKKDVVQSKAISGKRVLGATIVILVALSAFGMNEAGGTVTDAADTVTALVTSNETQKKIDTQYALAKRYQRRAHYWRHKRGAGHRYHNRISPKTDSLRTEVRRAGLWRKRAKLEHGAYVALKRQQRRAVNKCVNAGFPRSLCPHIIKGAKLEKKKSWAFDSNLAWIVRHESGFRPCVRNGGVIDCNYKGDRAYGLFQFLGSTWGGVGCRITSDATMQTRCGIRYISRRYGSSANAKAWWLAHRWY